MGTELYAGDLDGAAETVIERALSAEGGYASLTGVHGLTLAQRDPGLRARARRRMDEFPRRRAGRVARSAETAPPRPSESPVPI